MNIGSHINGIVAVTSNEGVRYGYRMSPHQRESLIRLVSQNRIGEAWQYARQFELVDQECINPDALDHIKKIRKSLDD